MLGKKRKKILLLGVKAAGKTTILLKLKNGKMRRREIVETIPTIGFRSEDIQYNNTSLDS